MTPQWTDVVRTFVDLVGRDLGVRTLILDGSANTCEYVDNYSDVDLKLFLTRQTIASDPYPAVAAAVRSAVGSARVKLNVWTLSERDYPRGYPGGYFDLVHRFVLKQGTVLAGSDWSRMIEVPRWISTTEEDTCVRQLTTILIRLGRFLTNPTAVTGFYSGSSEETMLQQIVAYYIHSMRYFNALRGTVTVAVEDTAKIFVGSAGLSRGPLSHVTAQILRFETTGRGRDTLTSKRYSPLATRRPQGFARCLT